jgi:hypothetical protein
MRQAYLIGVLATLGLLTSATTAFSQFWPGYGNYGYSGGWGGYPYGNTAALRSAAQTDRMMGQAAAMRQTATVQSGIRNTLSSQAAAQTQAILGQQQSNKDWWFQVQQQQLAQRPPMPQRSPMSSGAPVAGFESAASAPASPQAATDIIKWPPLLCDPQFAQQRARIEAPYRRSSQGQGNPTDADYQAMIEAAAQMKAILKQLAANISAQDYINADAFLDQLAAEARGRIAKEAPASERPSK